MISKGMTVTVTAGKKVAHGTSGVVFWVGAGTYGIRVGFKTADEETVWVDAKNVTVVGAAPVVAAPVAEPAPVVAPAGDAVVQALTALVADLLAKHDALQARVAVLEGAAIRASVAASLQTAAA